MAEFDFKQNYGIDDLLGIMKILRKDCPWDKEQTHRSIRMNFIEEAYEVLEAIDTENTELLREELGDVLLQVVFHSEMEAEKEEKGSFDFDGVCDGICKKLILRHPHIFGDTTVSGTAQVLDNWEKIKERSKNLETYTDTLESVAKSLPALMYAQKIGKKAAAAGMDFPEVTDVFECVRSETVELENAVKNKNPVDIEEELGDLLFSCVNLARHLKIDAESALLRAAKKFTERFSITENLIRQNGIDMKSLCINELDAYWNKAKKLKNGGNTND